MPALDRLPPEESLAIILAKLEELNYLPKLKSLTQEEEDAIVKRLESLGYL